MRILHDWKQGRTRGLQVSDKYVIIDKNVTNSLTMKNLIILEQGLKAFSRQPLSVLEGQVFWHLIQTLPITGGVVVTSELSSELKLSRERVGIGINKLRETGFIIRGVKIGRSYHYKLNPTFFKVL